MARRTAKLFGYNEIFDVYYFHGEGRDSLEKRGLFFDYFVNCCNLGLFGRPTPAKNRDAQRPQRV